jgi:cell division septation protein DedD
LVALLVSCSKKKEEAAKLEQEMMQQETTAADTTADTAAMPTDTTGLTQEEISAGAVPEESEEQFVSQQEETGYVVQVAACESRDYAQYLVEKYIKRGYEPYITTTVVDGQTFYRVRIGGLETLQAAKELKDELLDKYSVHAWIDEIE